MKIGMSISNYGTRLRYDGIDLLTPIDPEPDEFGNYDNVEGIYKTSDWELPLIFRMGISVQPIYSRFFDHSFQLMHYIPIITMNQ